MLALLRACLGYLCTSIQERSHQPIHAKRFMSPTIPLQSPRPVPDTNAVAVELPDAMECYNAVPKPRKPIETDSGIDALRQA